MAKSLHCSSSVWTDGVCLAACALQVVAAHEQAMAEHRWQLLRGWIGRTLVHPATGGGTTSQLRERHVTPGHKQHQASAVDNDTPAMTHRPSAAQTDADCKATASKVPAIAQSRVPELSAQQEIAAALGALGFDSSHASVHLMHASLSGIVLVRQLQHPACSFACDQLCTCHKACIEILQFRGASCMHAAGRQYAAKAC